VPLILVYYNNRIWHTTTISS